MSKRVILPVAFTLIGGLLFANLRSPASSSEAQAADPASVSAFGVSGGAASVPVLNRWFALGSGCRAKDDLPGDVTMELLPPESAQPNSFRARFHLGSLRLAPAELSDKTLLKFARECSIRLNINPPPGKKITKVTATTGYAVDKPAGAKVTILNELKIGNSTLGRHEATFMNDESVSEKAKSVSLVPGTRLDEPFPVLSCAEPKIIGFNYTWLGERTQASSTLDVQLSGAKTLDIEAELSACP